VARRFLSASLRKDLAGFRFKKVALLTHGISLAPFSHPCPTRGGPTACNVALFNPTTSKTTSIHKSNCNTNECCIDRGCDCGTAVSARLPAVLSCLLSCSLPLCGGGVFPEIPPTAPSSGASRTTAGRARPVCLLNAPRRQGFPY